MEFFNLNSILSVELILWNEFERFQPSIISFEEFAKVLLDLRLDCVFRWKFIGSRFQATTVANKPRNITPWTKVKFKARHHTK